MDGRQEPQTSRRGRRLRGASHRRPANLNEQFPHQVDVPADRVFVGLEAYQQALATDADLVVLATPPGFRPLHYAGGRRRPASTSSWRSPAASTAPATDAHGSQQAGRREEPAGGRRPAAPPRAAATWRPSSRSRTASSATSVPARVLERQRHLEPQPRAGHDRNAVPGPQLVPLLLAQRRQHLRAARPQPGRRQLGQRRSSTRSRPTAWAAAPPATWATEGHRPDLRSPLRRVHLRRRQPACSASAGT